MNKTKTLTKNMQEKETQKLVEQTNFQDREKNKIFRGAINQKKPK